LLQAEPLHVWQKSWHVLLLFLQHVLQAELLGPFPQFWMHLFEFPSQMLLHVPL